MPGDGGPGSQLPAHLVRKECTPPCTKEQCDALYDSFEAAYQRTAEVSFVTSGVNESLCSANPPPKKIVNAVRHAKACRR